MKEKVLTLRLEPEVHRRLKVLASEEGLSMKAYITKIVNENYENKFN